VREEKALRYVLLSEHWIWMSGRVRSSSWSLMSSVQPVASKMSTMSDVSSGG